MAIETSPPNTASTSGVTLTSSGSGANTKGAWVQLIASSAAAARGIWVYAQHNSATGTFFVLDIGIGTTVIIPNVLVAFHGGGTKHAMGVFIPISIPAASQIQGRIQSTASGLTIDVLVSLDSLAPVPVSGGTSYTDYGTTVSGATSGTGLTAPGSNNTKGAYVQLAASTGSIIKCLFVAVYAPTVVSADKKFLIDIATGAAASEVVVIPDLLTIESSLSDLLAPAYFGPFFVTIAAGTRLSARCAADDITAPMPAIAVYGSDFDPSAVMRMVPQFAGKL